jgi:pimeloyl-ACP methyl ester carboxylesterase
LTPTVTGFPMCRQFPPRYWLPSCLRLFRKCLMKLQNLLASASLFITFPLLAAPAYAQSSVTTLGSDVRMQVVQIESDPPGPAREAPGGGRILAPGLLYTPAKGANTFGPAIVMLDDGPGSHPLAAGQASRFAAERLAAQGYTVLSLFSGQERNFPSLPFDDVKWSIKNAIDYLERSGYEDFALAGQGYGALVAANYVKSFPDISLDNGPERRVKGLILINPLIDLTKYPRFGTTTGYDARYALAKKEVADGTGLYIANLEPGHSTSGKQSDWMMQGDYVGPAQAWINYWSPEAAARNAAVLKDLPVPTLVLAGDKVPMTPLARVKALAGAKVDVGIVAGGTDDLAPVANVVTDDIAAWLKAHDLGVRGGVRITAADTKTTGGVPLYGLVYEPEGGADPAKPVVMLIHGRSGDTLQASSQWIGWRLAQLGYKTIAPSLRISGATGIETQTMASTEEDIGHWIDAVGAKRVVLGGHSNGGIWISNYVSDTHDKRVAGMIYFAPTADAAEYMTRGMGLEAYRRDDDRAYRAIAAGRGTDEVLGVNTAVSFVELFGSKARTVHSDRVKEFDLPGLAIAGGHDELMSVWFLTKFTTNYKGKLTLVRYPEGTHGFRESKNRLAADTAAWLAKAVP